MFGGERTLTGVLPCGEIGFQSPGPGWSVRWRPGLLPPVGNRSPDLW